GSAELVTDPSTSLLPIQSDTNVGSASCMAWTWVRPPRMKVVSALLFDCADWLSISEKLVALGTATLLTNGRCSSSRSAQVSPAPLPTRACEMLLTSGGGQPGMLSDGTKNGAPAAAANIAAYDRCWVLSLIPADCSPAVMLLPIAT